MKKVLFTASTYSHIRSFHLPYLRYFQENGWEVHIACANLPEEVPYADKATELPFEKKLSAPANFTAAALLRRQIPEEKYDLICTHTSLAAFFTRLALVGMTNRPKVINMSHGYLFDDDTPRLKKTVLLAAERLMAPHTDLLLTMNSWDHAAAKHYQLGKCVVNIPGIGVDFSRLQKADPSRRSILRRQLGLPDDAYILFYAAEFSERKSQRVLIEAMTHLPDDMLLILAGYGAQLEECVELASSLGLENRVIIPGYVQNIGMWYAIADVVVTSSRSEGLPFNVMEAMYSGIPVVASRVKGHVDLIEEGETGLLYPYGDSMACARQIIRISGSSELKERIVRQAEEQVLQYGLDRVLPVVVEQYESVLLEPAEPLPV